MIRHFAYPIHMFANFCNRNQHPFASKRPSDFWNVRQDTADFRLGAENAKLPDDIPAAEPTAGTLPPIALLEAALFLAREPMSCRRLAQLAGLPEGTRTRQLLRELNQRYDNDQAAFCIVEVAEGFQLRTRPEFASWLARMQGVPAAVRLSNPAMETLTVIAYRQPVSRAEVDRIRGVQSGDLIRQLLDQGLAKIVGRSEDLGRPFLYGTTTHFLQIFGLSSLQDLPAA